MDVRLRNALVVSGLVLLLVPTSGWAQRGARAGAGGVNRAELTGFVGWQWGGGVTTRNGELDVEAAVNYGGILDIRVRRDAMFELMYSRQETELIQRDLFGVPEKLFDMSVEYLQGGGLIEFHQIQAPVVPFVSLTLGATHFNPDSQTVGSEWRFSSILGGGFKIMPSGRIGIRAQASLLMTFLDTGGSIFCGGGGCSLGFFGAGITQGDVSAGLTVAF